MHFDFLKFKTKFRIWILFFFFYLKSNSGIVVGFSYSDLYTIPLLLKWKQVVVCASVVLNNFWVGLAITDTYCMWHRVGSTLPICTQQCVWNKLGKMSCQLTRMWLWSLPVSISMLCPTVMESGVQRRANSENNLWGDRSNKNKRKSKRALSLEMREKVRLKERKKGWGKRKVKEKDEAEEHKWKRKSIFSRQSALSPPPSPYKELTESKDETRQRNWDVRAPIPSKLT